MNRGQQHPDSVCWGVCWQSSAATVKRDKSVNKILSMHCSCQKTDPLTSIANRPLYSCLFSDLAFEWQWGPWYMYMVLSFPLVISKNSTWEEYSVPVHVYVLCGNTCTHYCTSGSRKEETYVNLLFLFPTDSNDT